MKRIAPLFLFISLLTSVSFAQNKPDYFKFIPPITEETPEWAKAMYAEDPNVHEVDYLYWEYYLDNPFGKTLHTQNYKYWKRQIEEWVNEEGLIRKPTREVRDAFLNRITSRHQAAAAKAGGGTDWTCIGPFETYNYGSDGGFPVSWQANVYCMDISPSNNDIMFAGAEAGGVWKTIDKGLNWELVSQDLPIRTIREVKIDPMNPDIVYMAADNYFYKSIDGGATWSQLLYHNAGVYAIHIHPDDPNEVFFATGSGLVHSADAGANFDTLFSGHAVWDIVSHAADQDTMFLVKNNPDSIQAYFYKSLDGGYTWTKKGTGWYRSTDPDRSDGGARIGVTPADPDFVYVGLIGAAKAGDNGWIGVYRSTDEGETWVNPNPPDGGPYAGAHYNLAVIGTGTYHQGFYNYDIGVSHTDPGKVWIGTVKLNESADSGATWEIIGSYGSSRLGWIHPDIQDIEVNGSEIWVMSDGGINLSTDELMTHESRKRGLTGTDYWGFGSGWNEDVLVGGKYHNGNDGYYQDYVLGDVIRLGGAESPTGYVHAQDNRRTWFSDVGGRELPEIITGTVNNFPVGKYPNEAYTQSYSSEVEVDPRYSNHMYLGNANTIWKTTDGGSSWDSIYAFMPGRVIELEISRSNPDVLYAVFQPGGGYWDWCQIYRSDDAGLSWNVVTDIPAHRWRLEITLNPSDEDQLWVSTHNGVNGEKVYMTDDGGATWNNMTTSALDDDNPKDILYQAGTNDVVYLAMGYDVFYYDAGLGDWVSIYNGLPERWAPLEMRPFYRDCKLRTATYGRGIWERPLVAQSEVIAQPITHTDTVFCSRDTVFLDSYSVINNAGANWEWIIDPAPAWISSTSVRNPMMTLATEGAYDVTLIITDSSGNTDTNMVPGMIVLDNQCGADTFPGQMVDCDGSGGYISVPPLNMNDVEWTFTAWIKSDAIQGDYASIIMHDGTSAGINFRPGNQLAYHWPGGAWWWDSGLWIPNDEWVHVALVTTASSATVYLNGVGSTHSTSLDSVDFTSNLRFMNYKGWGGRYVDGQIDEVCIYRAALTQEEIRENMHLTKDPTTDPRLVRYYQFNESSGQALDKAGTAHASIVGGAERQLSPIPVAKGASDRMTISGTGVYYFNGTGMELQFAPTGVYPDGEVVVSRLNWDPHLDPDCRPNGTDHYWVINNYGANDTISSLFRMRVDSLDVSTAISADPGAFEMYSRPFNAYGATWGTSITNSTSGTPGPSGEIMFGTASGLTTLGQVVFAHPYFPTAVEICGGDSLFVGGAWQTTTGLYVDSMTTGGACDSLVLTDLTVTPTPGIPSITQIGADTLDAGVVASGYTWFMDGVLIPGANTQLIEVDTSGNYQVIAANGDCASDTSTIFPFVLVGQIPDWAGDWVIFPNPASDMINVEIAAGYEGVIEWKMFDPMGKLVLSDKWLGNQKKGKINLTGISSGLYFLTGRMNDKMVVNRIVVE